MRLGLIVLLILGTIAPSVGADMTDEPGAVGVGKCVVLYTDAFRYDADTMPQEKKDVSLWKRVTVAVCWFSGQETYSIISGEHLFREYWENGKLVRAGVGQWTFAPRTYLQKNIKDDVKPWEGGLAVMTGRSPFDDPYKED